MVSKKENVVFSVVVPTRNRPELFKLALDSILSQEFDSYEVIVVNDGSTEEFLRSYDNIKSEYSTYEKVRFYDLVHRPNGHGQSYSMNYGVSQSLGSYVCFLDDDDYWIDTGHLNRAYKSIFGNSRLVDVYYTNQEAYFSDGTKKGDNVWIEDLKSLAKEKECDAEGSYIVDVDFLLKSSGFAHLNCTIIKKELYKKIGGMDEGIRYECDRDFYIRTIDNANNMLYNSSIISKHNIPDVKKKDNMSTLVSFSEKAIYQCKVYDKGVALTKNRNIIDYCTIGKMYVLKNLAYDFYDLGDSRKAVFFASQALGIRFTIKWMVFTLFLKFQAIVKY